MCREKLRRRPERRPSCIMYAPRAFTPCVESDKIKMRNTRVCLYSSVGLTYTEQLHVSVFQCPHFDDLFIIFFMIHANISTSGNNSNRNSDTPYPETAALSIH